MLKQTCITRQLEGKWVMWENSCSSACWRVFKQYVHIYHTHLCSPSCAFELSGVLLEFGDVSHVYMFS